MAVMALGFILMFLGLAFMGLPELNRVLKQHDRALWDSLLGSESSLLSSSDRMTLFTWTLGRGFENSENIDIQYAGLLAYKRATRVKYTILAGISLIIIGSVAALIGL
ncbi:MULTISPECIES: hypothetical protein [unclassified Shewanella]|uniref:hypothetical protein n=1 Tax=unclassified Shewanella TaxID=196818 RepID=UPI001BC49775|nr:MULTISPECIES: hypothetical protein [unclassified Shewanella]GIU19760.1 hypothetical protein TUM4444_36510 [Shewanella sp. MBTL60-112-B1]GIU27796.1 hypothetical protein TUM4445_08270 [Shewanella sp. MBTL60-112-B2]